MQARELVAMFMESQFYYDLQARERLALVQPHYRRFSIKFPHSPMPLSGKVCLGVSPGTNADKMISGGYYFVDGYR